MEMYVVFKGLWYLTLRTCGVWPWECVVFDHGDLWSLPLEVLCCLIFRTCGVFSVWGLVCLTLRTCGVWLEDVWCLTLRTCSVWPWGRADSPVGHWVQTSSGAWKHQWCCCLGINKKWVRKLIQRGQAWTKKNLSDDLNTSEHLRWTPLPHRAPVWPQTLLVCSKHLNQSDPSLTPNTAGRF